MIEPIVGFLLCGALALFLPLYLKHLHREAAPDPAFEAWVAQRPLVAALRGRPGAGVDLLYRVRAQLGPGEFYNPLGGYPWQHYVVTLEARQLADGVVGLYPVAARLGREKDLRPRLDGWLDQLFRDALGPSEGVWLHARLRRRTSAALAREGLGWTGSAAADGHLELTPAIARPAWLEPVPQGAPATVPTT